MVSSLVRAMRARFGTVVSGPEAGIGQAGRDFADVEGSGLLANSASAAEPSSPEAQEVGAGPRWRPTKHWECPECFSLNGPGVAFCHRCGRLASSIEEALLVKEEFFVLDGLKALRVGDEETAHRCFALATEHDPQSDAAWYWRARTGETIDEVIASLEELHRLYPTDAQINADLDLARTRRDQGEGGRGEGSAPGMETSPLTEAAAGQQSPPTTWRYTVLEVASVPSFVIGLLLARPVILQVLSIVGIRWASAAFPTFRLPIVAINLPGDLVRPLPSSFNLLELILFGFAIWYLRLAFQLGERPSVAARVSAAVSGVLALAATQLIRTNGFVFTVCAILLLVLAVVGTTRPRPV